MTLPFSVHYRCRADAGSDFFWVYSFLLHLIFLVAVRVCLEISWRRCAIFRLFKLFLRSCWFFLHSTDIFHSVPRIRIVPLCFLAHTHLWFWGSVFMERTWYLLSGTNLISSLSLFLARTWSPGAARFAAEFRTCRRLEHPSNSGAAPGSHIFIKKWYRAVLGILIFGAMLRLTWLLTNLVW